MSADFYWSNLHGDLFLAGTLSVHLSHSVKVSKNAEYNQSAENLRKQVSTLTAVGVFPDTSVREFRYIYILL